jgi:hypothetical protein
VAGYNWICTNASIFVGEYLKELTPTFDTILRDSLSLVKFLETTSFPKGCLLFTVDFKSLYTNIPVDIAISMITELLNKFPSEKNELIIALLQFVLKNNIMEFNRNFFQQIIGVAMGTNVAPELANIFLAILEVKMKAESETNPKLIWPLLFKRFIDDGFGIMNGSSSDIYYFVNRFNSFFSNITIDKIVIDTYLAFMDLVIFESDRFVKDGRFDVKLFQKENCIYDYIPYNSDHQPHILKNFILGELKRYVRCCSKERDFLNAQLAFVKRLRNRGYPRKFISKLLKKVNYNQRFVLLGFSQNEDINEERLLITAASKQLQTMPQTFKDQQLLVHDKNNSSIAISLFSSHHYPHNKNPFLDSAIIFKLRGCFHFMKQHIQHAINHEFQKMGRNCEEHRDKKFLSFLKTEVICIQEKNISELVTKTKVS